MPTNPHGIKKLTITVTLIGVLALFGGIVVYGMSPAQYTNKQINLFLSINHTLAHAGDLLWQNITALGDGLVLFPLLSLLILKNPQAWAAFFGAIPVSTFLSHAGKALFAMPRPAAVIEHEHIHIIGHALTGATSLPSGHTITIFTVVSVLIYFCFDDAKKVAHPVTWSMALLALGILIALSRIAVGAHWPFDLVLGALLGSIGGLSGVILTCQYTAWWRWITTEKSKYIHATILCVVSVAMMLEYANLIVAWAALLMVAIVIYKLLTTRGHHAAHT